MLRRICCLAGAALLALWTAPVAAQAPFKLGDVVISTAGDTDPACVSQEDLERYSSAKETCLLGDPDDCRTVKDLETRGACGFHYDAYIVTSIDARAGLMQISPAADRSMVYWADVRDFKVVE